MRIWEDDYLLHCDCQSVIHLAKNATYHGRMKHIRRRYHWIRDQIEEKIFKLVKISTHENGSDMLTKILPRDKLEVCRLKAGLVITPQVGVRGRFVGLFPPTWRKAQLIF